MTEFTIVAFKQNQKKSVYYVTRDTPVGAGKAVQRSLEQFDADIISIRRIKEVPTH